MRPLARTSEAPDRQAGSPALAVVLAAAAGYVDAVGILYVSGVFVSFMSGNTTSTSVALGTGDWSSFAHVAIAIPLFVVGVVTGSLLLTAGRRGSVAVYVIIVFLLLLFLTSRLAGTVTPTTMSCWHDALTLAMLVVPMAILNTTLRRVGSRSIGLGYVTGTLVSFGEHLADALRTRSREAVKAAGLFGGLWVAFFGGGLLGAIAVVHVDAWAILVPIVVIAATGAVQTRRNGW